MKVLDASFLIDYLGGDPATADFYEEHGGDAIRWVAPVPALAEVLVGVGNGPDGDVGSVYVDLQWLDVHPTDEHLAVTASRIVDEIGPEGPYLDGPDALIAAVGRELDAPVVSSDDDFLHPETRRVVDVEAY